MVFVSQAAGGEQTLKRVVGKIEQTMNAVHEYFEPVEVSDLLVPDVGLGEVPARSSVAASC